MFQRTACDKEQAHQTLLLDLNTITTLKKYLTPEKKQKKNKKKKNGKNVKKIRYKKDIEGKKIIREGSFLKVFFFPISDDVWQKEDDAKYPITCNLDY